MQYIMAFHLSSNSHLSCCSSETMSNQVYHLISIYEYVLFVSHRYTKKERKEKAVFQTMLTLTQTHDFLQTPNVLGSQMAA